MAKVKNIFIRSKRTDLNIYEYAMPDNIKKSADKKAENALKKADSFLSSHKAVLALAVALLSTGSLCGMFLYRQGQFAYFHVNYIWNTFADKGLLYTLIFRLVVWLFYSS